MDKAAISLQLFPPDEAWRTDTLQFIAFLSTYTHTYIYIDAWTKHTKTTGLDKAAVSLQHTHKHIHTQIHTHTHTPGMDKAAISLQLFPPDEAWRTDTLEFIASLPVALERDDVRVCHACWHAPSIEMLRLFEGDVLDASR